MAALKPGPVFPVLETVSTRDRIVASLKDAFFSSMLKPGDPIVERELARQMKVGTPPVREALISLQEQGLVRRVANKGTYVTKFTPEEVRQTYALRVELELLAFQWAKARVTPSDLEDLERRVDYLVDAGKSGQRREFLERDLEFHNRCWELSGNQFLVDVLSRLLAPMAAFVVLASSVPTTEAMAREHFAFVNALRNLEEPEFSTIVRKTLSGSALRWVTAMATLGNHSGPSVSAVDGSGRHGEQVL